MTSALCLKPGELTGVILLILVSYEDDFFDKHELLGTYIVNVFSDLNNRLYYLDTYSEVEKFVKQIEEYKSKVESRGKFYL